MTPASSSALTRRQHGEDDRPTCSARSALLSRPSFCRRSRMRRSMASREIIAQISYFWRNSTLYRAVKGSKRKDFPRARRMPVPMTTLAPVQRLQAPARARAQGPVAERLDHPSRQSPAAQPRRAEGRRPPGLVRLARHGDDGALFLGAAAGGSRGGEAARLAGVPRHPVPVRPPDAGQARAFPRRWAARSPIPRAPRTSTTSISRPARSASASP